MHQPSYLIKSYLPTFCWQTFHEILVMLEQVDEDIDESSVRTTLTRLHQQGVVARKIDRRPTPATGKAFIYYYRLREKIIELPRGRSTTSNRQLGTGFCPLPKPE